MGKRGPKPTPTPILRLRGSNLAAGREHAEPAPGLPACPEWVSARARPYWAEVGAYLEGLGVMSPAYTVGLALLVDALANWIELTKALEKGPALVRGSTGNKVANPLHHQCREAWKQLMQACLQFGMTPSSITSVKSVTAKEKTGIDAFRLAE